MGFEYGKKRKKWPFVLIGILIVAAAATLLLWRFMPSGSAGQNSNVASAQAELGEVSTTVVGSGNLSADFKPGYMKYGLTASELLVKQGDSVSAGQALAKLDLSSIQSQISAVEQELEAVEDKISDLNDGSTEVTYIGVEMTATVKAIYASYGASLAEVMAEHGALMLLETASGAEIKVQGNLGWVNSIWVYEGETVYAGYTLLAVDTPTVSQSLAELEANRSDCVGRLEQLGKLLTDNKLYAPCDGTVELVNLQAGAEFTEQGAAQGLSAAQLSLDTTDASANEGAAFVIASSSSLRLSLGIDELDISSLQLGQVTTVELDAVGGSFSGEVTSVSDSADTSSSVASFSAVITLEKAEGMKIGMSATATIIKEQKSDVLRIPLAAMQQYGDIVYVYTALDESGNPSNEVVIETGLSDGAYVEVTSGLSVGATVYYVLQSSNSNSFMMMNSGNSFGGGGPETASMGRPATITSGPPR